MIYLNLFQREGMFVVECDGAILNLIDNIN